MSDMQAAVDGVIDACVKFGIALRKWLDENMELIARILPTLTNNKRKQYGLPMVRKQAIRRAKRNRRRKVQ